jgi:BirA family transcriptional regulator, biotin operon repressor / biotin---[acetyl-CoA-carboxylase] ligase
VPTTSHFLDAAALRAATFVRYIEVHEELGSTNDRAMELARQYDVELPALVVSRRQTAGRGRGRKIWWSAEGALTFSLLVDSRVSGILPANWPQLSLATAVAICDALHQALSCTGQSAEAFPPLAGVKDVAAGSKPRARLGVKWPNDVMLDGGKVAGILVESPGGGAPAKERLIVGIGLNINNSWRSPLRNFGGNGIALCDIIDRQHALQDVLKAVLNAVAERIGQLRARDPELIRAWQQLDLLAGEQVVLEADGRHVEGECVEIASDGALVINTIVGRQRYFSGSVRTT